MGSVIAILVLSFIVSGVLAYFVGKWYFKKDEEKEDRRRAAGILAIELAKVGFVKLPAFLVDYSVGDYSSMLYKLKTIVELATSDPHAFMREFDTVASRVLDAKLSTPEGRAVLAAKLQEANVNANAS